MIETVGKAILS